MFNSQSDRSVELIRQMSILVTAAKDPVFFINNFYYVTNPLSGQSKLTLNAQQERAIRDIHSGKQPALLMGSRQVGKSVIISAYLLWTAIFNENQNLLIVSNSLNRSADILDKIRFAFERLPAFLKPTVTVNNKCELQFQNGSKFQVRGATEKLLRGQTISIMYVDEMAYLPASTKQMLFEDFAPCLAIGAKFIAASSPNGYELFYQLWEDAYNGNGMTCIKLLASEDPTKTGEYFRNAARFLPEDKFRQEYLCELVIAQ